MVPRGPHCTHSQIVTYFELDGKPVPRVHHYRRKDGTLRGRPDPKRIMLPDRTLAYSPNREPDYFE